MSPYEKQRAIDQLAEMRAQYRGAITAGTVAKWSEAVEIAQRAQVNLDNTKRKAAARWDPEKLNQELQLARSRVEIATRSDAGRFNMAAIGKIIDEAETSKDPLKMRAAYEAIQDIAGLVPRDAQDTHGNDLIYAANRLAKYGAQKLQELNLTPEVMEAAEVHKQAVDYLTNTRREVVEHMEVLGDARDNYLTNDAVKKALERVDQDNQGNFIIKDA